MIRSIESTRHLKLFFAIAIAAVAFALGSPGRTMACGCMDPHAAVDEALAGFGTPSPTASSAPVSNDDGTTVPAWISWVMVSVGAAALLGVGVYIVVTRGRLADDPEPDPD